MNYPENKIQWKIGTLVIHDADAKNSKMLMEIIGYRKDGMVITKYISTEMKAEYKRKNRWINPPTVLHDPKLFGVELQASVKREVEVSPTKSGASATPAPQERSDKR